MASKDRFATVVTIDNIIQAIQSRIPKKTLQTINGHMAFEIHGAKREI